MVSCKSKWVLCIKYISCSDNSLLKWIPKYPQAGTPKVTSFDTKEEAIKAKERYSTFCSKCGNGTCLEKAVDMNFFIKS
jgi:hypothetical protein